MKVKNLVRPEVLALKPYVPAKKVKNKIRLNANESPYTVTEFAALNKLNLYPDARPDEIRNKIADYLNINEDRCVVTRGSTEAIDLLIRTFCSPHVDEIIIFPPTFEMYQFYAAIQGIKVVPVNLMSDHQYAIDIELFQKTVSKKSKLIFICSPSNPIGHSFDKETIYSIDSFIHDSKAKMSSHLKVEELSQAQEEMLSSLCESIVCSQNKESWDETLESCVKDFNKIEDLDTLREVLDISSEHSLETYPAAILYHSHEK